MTIHSSLLSHSGPALCDAKIGRVVGYDELSQLSATVAEALHADKRCLVFCLVDVSVDAVASYLGSLASKHCVCMLDAAISPTMLEPLLNLYRPDYVIGPDHRRSLNDDFAYAHSFDDLDLHVWQRRQQDACLIHEANSLLLPTSGSTGNPKMVRLSQQNLLSNAASIVQYLSIDEHERPIVSLPFHYSYGLSVLNSHLLAGGCLVLTTDSILVPSFWDAFRDQSCTSFAGVPFQYTSLLRIGFEKFELPSLKTMTQAGGKLADRVVTRFWELSQRNGFRFFVMYGQTEATARMSYLPQAGLPAKIGSVGVAIPGGTISIENEDPESSEGEVVYRGPNVSLGYANNREDLSRDDERGGMLRTGDLGHLDQEGYLYITGRSGRFAKVFGLRLSLADIEASIDGDVVAVASQDSVTVCHDATLVDAASIKRHLAEKFRIHHSAFKLQAMESIPLTANGKPNHKLLMEMFGET